MPEPTPAPEPSTQEPTLALPEAAEYAVAAAPQPLEADPAGPAVAPTIAAAPASPAEPRWIGGPAPVPIVIGLLGLVAALVAILAVTTTLHPNWAVIGPVSVIGVGALVIALGLLGMRRDTRGS
ncbi:MAG TPA: hypothetical protein PLX71_07305 [Phycicoccus sp.]|nr:hypothetical protein [Phycicoccus sp.]